MIDDDAPHMRCPWSICECTHVGCVNGWVDRRRDDGTPEGKQYVSPCPQCRPEVARHLSDKSKSLRRLRYELPELPRPSRGPTRRHRYGDDDA